MDKISKRSKGYAFLEYTTEEAASAALKEMNGKVKIGFRDPRVSILHLLEVKSEHECDKERGKNMLDSQMMFSLRRLLMGG